MTDPKRILVVDDEELNRHLLEIIVKSFGYECELARNGFEAIEKLNQSTDLVLLDVRMPGMDGYETARRIRKKSDCRDVPIIIATVLTGKEDRLHAVEAGANDFVSKPIDRVELRVRMESLLKMKESQDEVKRHRTELESIVQRRTEELRESEEKYRSIVDNMEEGCYEVDLAGNVSFCNDALGCILGYGRDEMPGMNFRRFMDEANGAKVSKAFDSVLSSGKPMRDEAWDFVTKDGSVRNVEASGTPVRDAQGTIRGFRGIVRDVTKQRLTQAALQRAHDELERRVEERTAELVEAGNELRRQIKERTLAEKAFRDSEKRFRTAFHTSPDSINISRLQDGVYIDINEGFTVMSGYSREDVIGKSSFDINLWHDPSEREKLVAGLKSAGYVRNLEARFRRKDGRVGTALISARVMSLEGQPHILSVTRDIDDWKKTQDALRESEQRLELALAGADLALWDWNVQTGEAVFNRRWAEMLGYDPRDVEPQIRSWEKLLHPDDVPVVMQALNAHLNGTSPAYETEHRLRTKSGDWLWVLDRGKVVNRDAQGRPLRAVGTHLDITTRKSAEMALRQSEEKYRKILETIADGYHEADLAGNLILVNDSLCEILGYSREELIGMNYRNLMDEHNAQLTFQAYNEVFHTGVPNPEFSYQAFRKDGTRRDVSLSIALIRDAARNPVGFRGIFRDITERRQLEEQLRQAVKMEAIGRLAGGIAHDFNNLLTAIMGYTSMLSLEMPQEERVQRKLDQISRTAARAADLTRQLLAFSRKQVLEVSVLNFNNLIEDIESMLRRLIGEDIELTTDLRPGIGNVRADQGQLEQVVVNLAVNARDAMPGGGTLTIETCEVLLEEGYCASRTDVKPGEYVMLSISDTGDGMTPETCNQVFDPFFTTKEKGRGTGLGLSMAYGTIKQHGGHIAVYSEAGTGTSFKIYLPRVQESLSRHVPNAEPERRSRGTETILLVEDEETVRDLAGEALEMLGYRVLKASSPAEAVEIAANHPDRIDLLLTDVVLPRMDGKTLYVTLAAGRPEMKVLYVSGYTENFIVHRGILDPEVSFLQKPFTLDGVARKVRAVLDQE
ncbi:MAG: PAS domain S-box protein [Pseudomonadota bacterium]